MWCGKGGRNGAVGIGIPSRCVECDTARGQLDMRDGRGG